MPNWRKVITSGSDASLNTLTVTNGITGSLLGTASYASQALSSSFATTASYVLQAISASFATTSTTQTAGNSTTAVATTAFVTTADNLKANLATPTFTTNITTPLIIGGTAVGSTLTYKTTTGVGTTDAHIFQVGNNGATESMRITNTGDIGIGTTSPVSLLNISNTPVGGTTGGNPTFTFLDTRNLNAGGWLANTIPLGTIQAYTTDPSTTPNPIGAITFIAPQLAGSSPACDISFSTGDSGTFTERMRILNSGKVGIGTTNPTDFVEIADATTTAGAAGLVIRQSGANVSTGYAAFFNKTGASVTNIAGYFTATGATNNYAIIVPSTGGRVGIGTATPTAVLHLKAGTATANTAPLKFTSGATMSIAEAGSVEFLTDAYYGTITTGAARKTFAFLESPTFTGTPTLPTGTIAVTQASNTNNTTVATTAYADANQIFSATASLSSAQIKALFTTPIQIVANPGSGKYIEVISATSEMTFATAAYTTNTTLQIISSGSNVAQVEDPVALLSTVSRNSKFVEATIGTGATTETQILSNVSLVVKAKTGNPGVGAGTAKIKLLYRIVTI